MASTSSALGRATSAYLANRQRAQSLCAAIERFLSEQLRNHPDGSERWFCDGIIPDEITAGEGTVNLRGYLIWSDDHGERKETFSGELRLAGQEVDAYSFVFEKSLMIFASPGEYPLVSRVHRRVAADLETGLRAEGETDLADRVADLRYHGPCICDLADCESFRTAPALEGGYGEGHRNLTFVPRRGSMLVLDVVGTEIKFVEILAL